MVNKGRKCFLDNKLKSSITIVHTYGELGYTVITQISSQLSSWADADESGGEAKEADPLLGGMGGGLLPIPELVAADAKDVCYTKK